MAKFFKDLKKDILLELGLDVPAETKPAPTVPPPPWYKPSVFCSKEELDARAAAEAKAEAEKAAAERDKHKQERQKNREKMEAPIRERLEQRRMNRGR